MTRVVFVGNCQAFALSGVYEQFIRHPRHDVVDYVNTSVELTDATRATLEAADVIVEQRFDQVQLGDIASLDLAARRVGFPLVAGRFLWPFSAGSHIHNRPHLPGLPAGPYPWELADTWLNDRLAEGVDADEAVERYLALDLNKLVRLDRLMQLDLATQRRRDAATGIDIAGFIEMRFREEPIFDTPHHLALPLFRQLATGVLEKMGVGQSAIERMQRNLRPNPFGVGSLPIHPSVCRHFQLAYGGETYRYPLRAEGSYTFGDYFRRYMRYEFNADLGDGIHLARHGQLDEAEAKLLAGLDQSPDGVDGWLALGDVRSRQGRPEEALAATETARRLAPDSDSPYNRLGDLLRSRGDLVKAEQAYRDALQRGQGMANVHNNLSHILAQQGMAAEAVAQARHAVAIAPFNPHYRGHLGYLLLQQNDLDGAIQAFTAVLDVEPGNIAIQLALSDTLARNGMGGQALEAAEQAVRLAPSDLHAQSNLGHLLVQAGALERAEAAYRAALAIDPAAANVNRLMASMLIRTQRNDEALAFATAAVVSAPDDVGARIQLAGLHAQAGNLDDAELHYAAAIALRPDDAGLHNAISHIHARQHRTEAALAAARAAAAINPNSFHVQGHLGNLLLGTGDAAQAVEAFKAALRAVPGDGATHAAMSRALAALGRLDEARAAADRAVEYAPGDAAIAAHRATLTARAAIPHAVAADTSASPHRPIAIGTATVAATDALGTPAWRVLRGEVAPPPAERLTPSDNRPASGSSNWLSRMLARRGTPGE